MDLPLQWWKNGDDWFRRSSDIKKNMSVQTVEYIDLLLISTEFIQDFTLFFLIWM